MTLPQLHLVKGYKLLFYSLPVEKHIIVGAEEGVYSLNFSEQLHEAEMEQVTRMSLHEGISVFIWETAHLPFLKSNINTYFSLWAKC